MVSEDPEFAEFEFGGDDFCGSCAVIRFSVNLSRSVREYVPPLPPDDGPTGSRRDRFHQAGTLHCSMRAGETLKNVAHVRNSGPKRCDTDTLCQSRNLPGPPVHNMRRERLCHMAHSTTTPVRLTIPPPASGRLTGHARPTCALRTNDAIPPTPTGTESASGRGARLGESGA